MSVRTVKAGSADVSVVIRIVDSTDGTPETGVVFNTAGIDLWYRREGEASVDITEATLAALTTAHTDGGFLHINDGWYRLDLPDAAVADGVTGVQIGGTVTGMVVLAPYIELVDYNPYDGVRLGLTALPNAAADAAGGLPISDAGGLDLDAKIGALTFTVANKVDANATHISGDSGAADNAEAFFDGTGYAGTNNVIPTVTNLTNLPAITANWLTAAGTAADFGTEIGAAVLSALGTGTWATAIPWNASWDAEVQSEVQDAIEVNKLDHLVAVADADDVVDNSIIAKMSSKGATADWSTFVNTTDALEALRDRGDAAWITATGFSTHSAADVWAAGTRTLTALDEDSTTIDLNGTTVGGIQGVTFPSNFSSLGINASGHVSRVVLVDTLTTYTGNTVQTGDSYSLLTSAVADSVPADGTRPSPVQALYMIVQALTEGAISGTTWTIKKVDGSTTLFTVTLDSATTPTSKTRAS